MILRVFRGRVAPGREDDVVDFVRDQAITQALAIPGLLSFQPGVRTRGDGRELVIVTTWVDFASLLATGRDLDTPITLPSASAIVSEGHADHYELVFGGARGLPLGVGTLRITSGTIRPNAEASYFTRKRELVEPLLDDAGLHALHLGRRVDGGRSEVVAVTLWTDTHAVEEAVGRDISGTVGGDETGAFFDVPPLVEHFDALTVTRGLAGAPAVLLADDHRRYLHATPAAARLTRRSISRLLALRVEDLMAPGLRPSIPALWEDFLAAGTLEGPMAIALPDASELTIRFSARARTPWPGCHASMLAAIDAPEPPDIDHALAQAGLVSRYAVGI